MSTIRFCLDPYRNQRVFDLYVHEDQSIDYFLIRVSNKSESEQLIKLVEKAYEISCKIIVLTPNLDIFRKMVNNALLDFNQENFFQRRTDRLRIIFPHFF